MSANLTNLKRVQIIRRVANPQRGRPREIQRQTDNHRPSNLKGALYQITENAVFQFGSYPAFEYPNFGLLNFQELQHATHPGSLFNQKFYRKFGDPRGVIPNVEFPPQLAIRFGY